MASIDRVCGQDAFSPIIFWLRISDSAAMIGSHDPTHTCLASLTSCRRESRQCTMMCATTPRPRPGKPPRCPCPIPHHPAQGLSSSTTARSSSLLARARTMPSSLATSSVCLNADCCDVSLNPQPLVLALPLAPPLIHRPSRSYSRGARVRLCAHRDRR